MIRLKRNSGVTLLELLIVMIIIGILAAIAVPRFLRTAEDARVADATKSLGEIRSAILTVRGNDPSYNPTADINGGGTDTISSSLQIITFNNPSAYWGYTYDNATSRITATRLNVPSGTAFATFTIVMDLNTGMYDISDSTYDSTPPGGTLPEPTQA